MDNNDSDSKEYYCNLSEYELHEYHSSIQRNNDVIEDLKSTRIYLRLIGLAANLVLLVVAIIGLRLKLLYPRRYVFVMSRTIADTLACLSIAVIVWVRQYTDVPAFLLGASIVVITISVYSASVCNCALAVVTFVAISKPFFYKTHVTLRRCFYVVASVWCFAAIIGTTTTVFGVATYKPKRMDSCPLACQRGLKILGASIVWAMYILSPAAYILILISIKRSAHENNVKEVRDLWKLGLNILAFAVFSLPSCVDQAIAIEHLKQWQTADIDKCYDVIHWRQLYTMRIIYEVAQVAMSLRVIVDPIIACLIDEQARYILFAKCPHRCTSFDCKDSRDVSLTLGTISERSSGRLSDRIFDDDNHSNERRVRTRSYGTNNPAITMKANGNKLGDHFVAHTWSYKANNPDIETESAEIENHSAGRRIRAQSDGAFNHGLEMESDIINRNNIYDRRISDRAN